ncbi:MAG: hypothetical protein RH859_07940 [Longimicrobiales bacterium]
MSASASARTCRDRSSFRRLRAADGAEQTVSYRYTSAFLKRNDAWRMLALQMDRLGGR